MPTVTSITLDTGSCWKKGVSIAFNSDVEVIPPITSTLVSLSLVYMLVGYSS